MLDKLTAWGRTCGLHFNPAKTVVIHFTRRSKRPPFQLTVDGKPIPYSTTTKYLGVVIDSRLEWKTHIQEKMSKGKSS